LLSPAFGEDSEIVFLGQEVNLSYNTVFQVSVVFDAIFGSLMLI